MSDKQELLRANIEAALEHGIDIRGRRVFLHGEVDEETISTAIRGLYLLSDMDLGKPIELYVSSYGGDEDEAFALHDVTRTIKAPVHTIALGKCMSAAPLLVACGQKGERYGTENTTFMLHDTTMGMESDSPANIAANAAIAELNTDRLAILLGRYSKQRKRFWKRIFASKIDRYFDVWQAMEWGLIDQVWSEK